MDKLCFGRWDAFEVRNAENMMEISGCEGRSNLKMWAFFSVSIHAKVSETFENCEKIRY